ncbi:hypothetical protein [Leptospira sp. 'Mane']|uniref:hypothetical protein n=1 Tax=Leptospira sp. 'Mane' TaxID=3387407 RepID=UPI00398A9DB9
MLDDVKNKLRKGFDPNYTDYLGNVEDESSAIQRAIDTWSEAIYECAKAVVPVSTTATLAQTAFESAAEGMNLDGSVFSAAVAAFASTLGTGMAGYTTVPPSSSFIPTSLNESNEDMCKDFSDQLIAWFQTGTATLIAPPNTVSNWS